MQHYSSTRLTRLALLFSAALVALIASFALTAPATAGSIHHVKWNAAGANNGTNWTNAYTDLQSALTAAVSGDEIWVAEGTYLPTSGSNRAISFQLKNGVGIYGGFAGGEGSRSLRNWNTHVTILSGNVGNSSDPDDNSYHVVTGFTTNATAVIDGFTISNGVADSGTYPDYWGGGMYLQNASATVSNILFTLNWSKAGGGMYNDFSAPIVTNVTFYHNYADVSGGGMYNSSGNTRVVNVSFLQNAAGRTTGEGRTGGGLTNLNCSPTLINVIFSENYSFNYGGALYNYASSPVMVNVTFGFNGAVTAGGAIYNFSTSYPTMTNGIIWDNLPSGSQIYTNTTTFTATYSLIQGGYVGVGNIDTNPLFARDGSPGPDGTWATEDDDLGDLRLRPYSPAIDAGDNSAVPQDSSDLDGDTNTTEKIPLDLDKRPRFINPPRADTGHGTAPIVDMGAYESPVNIFLPFVKR